MQAHAQTLENLCSSLDLFSGICSLTSDNFGSLLSAVINLILVLAVVLAVVYFIYGGIKWILSRGDKEQIDKAKSHIVASVVGLGIVFLAFFIVNVVFGFFFPGKSIEDLTLPSLGPDTVSPSVSVASPAHDSTVFGTTSIQVNAQDNKQVTKVELYIDGALKYTDSKEPYEYSWDTKIYRHNSAHAILAKAYDGAGNTGVSTTINVIVVDMTKPNVSITNLIDGGSVSPNTAVTILTQASDISGIAQVEFRVNGVLKCTDTTALYSCLWQVPAAKGIVYRLDVSAYDIAGNVGNASVSLTAR